MKPLYFTFIFLFISLYAHSQDTLIYKNGQKKIVKTIEISPSQIKYYRFGAETGPEYTDALENIQSIKYSNGTSDIFRVTPESEKLTIYSHSIKNNAGYVSDKSLRLLIKRYPKQEVIPELNTTFAEKIQLGKRTTAWAICGMVAAGTLARTITGAIYGAPVFIAAAGASAVLLPVSFHYMIKNLQKKRRKTREFVDLYNNNL